MRFSSCCTSISPSTRPTRSSRRAPMSSVSSSFCLSDMRTPRCAAMVSARRLESSMPLSVCSNSGGNLRLVLTYCSNSDISERATASTSRVSRADSDSTTVPVPDSAPSFSSTSVTRERDRPSTSTLIVPSGSFSSCSTCASVPISCRSFAPGASVSADFCATSRMRLSDSIAWSSARIDLSRPTNNGMTMCGNTTTSRSGSTGRSEVSACWVMWAPAVEKSGRDAPGQRYRPGGQRGAQCAPLARLWGVARTDASARWCKRDHARRRLGEAVRRSWNVGANEVARPSADGRGTRGTRQAGGGRRPGSFGPGGLRRGRRRLVDEVRLGLVFDHRLVHHHLAHVFERRQFVHRVEQHRLDDRAQAARASLALERLLRDGGERIRTDLEFDAFHLEQLAELLADRVLRLREDLHQRRFVEFLERRDHRQAADEFGDQAELDQIFRFDFRQDLAHVLLALGAFHLRAEADAAGFRRTLLDDLVQAGERAADDEQDVARVDLQEFLLRVLAAALRRHAGDGAFDELQQRLLHALARHVARDRRVFALARDLVDLVDVHDALLRLLDVVVALLQELLDDVLDVLADVAGFGERRRVGDG